MPLVTSTEMFKKAYDGGYAIGAFNVNNMEIIQGITEAAKELNAPLILQVSSGARKYARHAYLVKLVEAAMEGDCVSGTIDVLDVRFGSLWTNIPRELFLKLGLTHGSRAEVTITNDTRTLYKNIMVYARSFADVNVGEPLLYVNSLDCVAVAINQGSFSKAYNIGTGITWRITLRKAPRIIYE